MKEEKNKKEYKTGRNDIDKIITDLAKECDSNDNIDLVEEMLTTVVKLVAQKRLFYPNLYLPLQSSLAQLKQLESLVLE